MQNFNYNPSNIDLYKAICKDFRKAVETALKNGSRKVNKREVFKANAMVYWSVHRSAKDSRAGFLAIMDEINKNRQKKKKKKMEVSLTEDFKKVPGPQMKIVFPR